MVDCLYNLYFSLWNYVFIGSSRKCEEKTIKKYSNKKQKKIAYFVSSNDCIFVNVLVQTTTGFICYVGIFGRSSATNFSRKGGQMRKRILCIAAAFVKKVAVDAVSETSDWYTYQSEEPEEVRKLCSKLNEKNIYIKERYL